MGYTLLQISQILLKADRTMYKIGSIAYDDMFNQLDEALDYNRDIIYIYKKAVEYADDFYVGTEKLDTVVEKLGQKIAVYDYGQLNPVYSDATIVNSVIPMGSVLNDLNDVTITNVQDNQILRYNAALQQWVNVGTGNAVRNIQQFTSTAAQTTFTTAFQFDGGLVDIFVNGVKLSPPSYTLFGNYTIILTDACLVGDIVEVVAYENNIAFIDLSQYYVPVGRTLTINGVAYDLSANRSWNVGTVTSVNMTVPTGLTISGNPIVSSGTLALGLAAGYFIPTTASQANWDAAYNDKINSASVTGTTTKTLTLTQQDGGTITASWSDFDTAPVTSVFGRTGAIIATSGDYTTTLVTEGTNLYYLDSRARQALSLTTIGTSGVATYDNTTGIFNIPNYGSVLTGYVPYTGATTNVDLGEFEIKAGQFTLDVSPTGTAVVGTTRWNNNIGSSETTLKGGNVLLKNGVDLVARVVNKVFPNATLTKAAYQAVRVTGAQGQRLAVAYAQANNDNNSADTIGLVCETIATNQEGFIITVGQIEDINTTGSLQGETWVDGDVLYLSPTTPGAITNVKPIAPQHLVIIGYVEYAHANNGKIYVKVMNGWELGELHDVNTTGAVNGSVLKYNGSIWVPSSDTGITSLNGLTALSQTFATGTSGTDFNISSATSTHTFNLPTASAVNRGVLSSADWTSFDSKQPALSGTGIVKSTSGVISYITDNSANWNTSYDNMIVSAAVTGTTTKTLTLTQQDAGTITASWTDYAPVLSVFGRTGSVIAQSGDYNTTLVTEGTNLYFTDPRVMAAMLTGFTVGSNTAITFNDSVLTAFGKSQAQINTKQNIVTLTTTGSSGSATFISDTLNVPTYTLAGLGGQPQLNGTGFVKISGTTISYDNSTYALDSAVVHNTGTETVAGAKTFTSAVTSTNFVLSGGTGNTGLYYGHTNKVVLANYVVGGGIDFETNGGAINMVLDASGNLDVVGNVTGASIIKSGGTSSQFLKADGSVDSTTYQSALTLTTTGSSGASTFISNTLNVPTYTLSGLGGVPTTRTLTINGTSYDLSANRTWSVGTVTTAAATTGGQVMFSNGATVITSVSGLYFDGVDKLGVGNISPAYNLDVTGTFRSTGNLTAASIIKSGGTSSQYLMADGSTSTLTNPVTGTGTTNYLPKWTSGSAIGNSIISASATLVTNNFGTSSLFFGQSGSTRFGFATGTATLAFSTGLPLVLGTFDGQPLVFGTNNTENARLTDGGNLLVNSTTDNGNRLQVTGTASFTGNVTSNVQFISNNGTVETRLSYSSTPAGVVGTISNHPLELYTNGNAKATISTSGNLGLGVVPSAWGNDWFRVMQLGNNGAVIAGITSSYSSAPNVTLGNNYYLDSTDTNKYVINGESARYRIVSGQHQWQTAPSGTAGNAISFTQAMTLTAAGRLLLGTTTEGTHLLDVAGNGRFASSSSTNLIVERTGSNGVFLGLKDASGSFAYIGANNGDFIVQTPTGSYSTKLTIANSGAATFSSSVTATIFDSTSNAYRLNGNNALSLVSLGGQSVVKINAAGYWGTQLVGANDQGILINNTGNVLVGTTTDSGEKLQVNGTGRFVGTGLNDINLQVGNSGTNTAGNTAKILFYPSGSYTGTNAPGIIYTIESSATYDVSTKIQTYKSGSGVINALTLASTGAATFSSSVTVGGLISASTEYRLNNNSYSRVAILDGGGAIAGGYNFNINGGTAQHDSTGALSAYYYNSAGYISFFTNSSQSAGTAATERVRITSGGNLLVGTTTDNGNRLQVTGNGYFLTGTNNNILIKNATHSTLTSLTTAITFSRTDGISDLSAIFGWNNGGIGLSARAGIVFATGGTSTYNNTIQRMTLNEDGNLGLGVTPSAWASDWNVFQIGSISSLSQYNNNNSLLLSNNYYNATTAGASPRYIVNGAAGVYQISGNNHYWYNAPSGTAGNAITLTQAMALTANGRLLLGTTTEGTYLLDVNGTGRFTGITTFGSTGGSGLRVYGASGTNQWDMYLNGANIRFSDNTGTGSFVVDRPATFSSSVTTNEGIIGNNSNNLYLSSNSAAGEISFWGNQLNTRLMTIKGGGNLLVGTNTDSGEKLQISGSAKVTSTLFAESNITFSGFIKPSSNVGYGVKSTDGAVLQEWYNGLNKFYSKVNYTPMATPSSPSAGDVYYDSTTNKLRCYNGTSWNDLF